MQMPRSLALIVLTARASVSPLCARGSLSFQRATPPLAPSRGPVRKKQRGRGSQRPVESEFMPAQIPRASLSPHREVSPVLFSQPALKKRDMRGCLNWMSQWLHISAHPLPSAGRRKPITHLSHAGPLQRSLDAPTLQLDRRLRRSTLWRFSRSIRPSSSLP